MGPLELAIAGVGTPLMAAVAACAGGAAIRWRAERRAQRLCRGTLVLTFDDGPGRVLEPALLEVLARHGARATFFLVGNKAEENPDRCEALVAAGHEIGSHGYAHVDAWRSLPWRGVVDTRRGLQAVQRWCASPRLFRPPYGKLTIWTWWAARRRGALLVPWTHNAFDGDPDRCPSPAAFVETVVASQGGVVLLHSFDRRDPNGKTARFVIAATDALLAEARQRRWRVSTASELLGRS